MRISTPGTVSLEFASTTFPLTVASWASMENTPTVLKKKVKMNCFILFSCFLILNKRYNSGAKLHFLNEISNFGVPFAKDFTQT
jgi:hypothetical protein